MKDNFNKMSALCESANNKMKFLSEGHRVSQVPKKIRHLQPSGTTRTTAERSSPTATKALANAQRADLAKPVKYTYIPGKDNT